MYRLYKEEGLAMRKKVPRRRVACVKRARERIEAWRKDYYAVRPHSSPENQTPEQFAAQVELAVQAAPPLPAQPELHGTSCT